MNPVFCTHITKQIIKQLKRITRITPTCEFVHAKPEPDTAVRLWVCCECFKTGCSRVSANRCMERHAADASHALCYNVPDTMLWCYRCDRELHEMLIEREDCAEQPAYREL